MELKPYEIVKLKNGTDETTISKDLERFKIKPIDFQSGPSQTVVEETLKELCDKHNKLVEFLSIVDHQ